MLSLGLAVTSSLTSIDGLVRGPYSEGGLFPRLALDFDDNKYATDVGPVTFADAFTAGSPKLTYSTTSNSSMVNSSGNLVWAPHNLVTYSEDFSQWTASSGTTVTAGATSPTGQTDAYQITLAGNNDNVQLTTAGLSTSTAVQYSVYLRVSSGTQSVNLGNIDAGQYQSVTVTTEWQRFVITQTPSATTRFPRILNGTNDSFTVEAFGAHLFRSDLGGMSQVPGAATGFEYYVPTNGAAKYLPRVGHHVYSGSAWVNEGLLIESEARTNLITDSIPDSNWSPIRATISENVSGTVAPDGSQTASKGVESSASGTHRVDFVATLTDTNTYTYSIFAKAAERSMIAMEIGNSSVTGNFARFDLSSGSVAAESGTVTSSIENFGNGWYRCRVTAAAGTTDRILIGIFDGASQSYAGDGSSGVFLWGAQLEENPTASSHIPTSGATATRAAQTLVVPPAAFGWNSSAVSIQMEGRMTYANEGTFVAQRLYKWAIDGNNFLDVLVRSDANLGQVVFRQKESGTADEKTTATGTYSPGTLVSFNIAARHGSTFINGAVDGTALTANTTPTALADLENTNLEIAQDFMGTIRTFRQFAGDIGDAGLATATS